MKEKIFIVFSILLAVGLIFAPNSFSESNRKIVIAIGEEPSTMDQSRAYVGADFVVQANYAEQLLCRSTDGKIVDSLASSWNVSPDGKILEFRLRKDVKFHSGDLLTAKDIEFSFKRAAEKSTTMRTRLKAVERIEILDDYHFKIYLKTFDAPFIPSGAGPYIVSKSYYDRVGEEEFSLIPSGTGPYKFVKYVPGEYVDIERFNDYWGEKPQIKSARFLFISEDTTRMAKLKTGEISLNGSVPYAAVKDIISSEGLKMVKAMPGHPTPSILFHTLNPDVPWADRRVRLAMAYAIDYDAIINDVCLSVPSRYAYLAPYELGYDPELKPYDYDPGKAKKLLAEAGYAKGFDLPLTVFMTGRVPMVREVVDLIATYFEAIGIKTKLITLEAGAFYATMRKERKKANKGVLVMFASVGPVAGGYESTNFMYILLRTGAGFSQHSDPEFDKIIDECRATVDDTDRAKLIVKAQRLIHEEAPVIPIYNYVPIYAMQKNVNYKPTVGDPFNIIYVKDISLN